MNKTKRTLIISSIVMALAFIVTVVSVTAAWFSNVSSSKQDGFIIGSTTLKESATISIDTNVGGSSDVSIWPAVVKKGYLAQGGRQQPDRRDTVCVYVVFHSARQQNKRQSHS